MPEPTLVAVSAFSRLRPVATTAISIAPRDDVTIASIAPLRGQDDAVASAILNRYGVALPAVGRRIEAHGLSLQWAGPSQWLAMAERREGRDLELELKPLLARLAAVVDQSDARAVLGLAGVRAPDVLAKGVPIDIHPREFPSGAVAITHAGHIGITLARIDDTPTFEISVPRSYADSFADWLSEAAAAFTAPMLDGDPKAANLVIARKRNAAAQRSRR